jgi:hypothetical protein
MIVATVGRKPSCGNGDSNHERDPLLLVRGNFAVPAS